MAWSRGGGGEGTDEQGPEGLLGTFAGPSGVTGRALGGDDVLKSLMVLMLLEWKGAAEPSTKDASWRHWMGSVERFGADRPIPRRVRGTVGM